VSLGDEFLKHFTYAIFPLTHSIWKAINDKHNRARAAPDHAFKDWFGRKVIGHKSSKQPCLSPTVHHLQELWIGMGKVLTKGNWPEVSLKIKHLSMLIQKYVERITSQAARQLVLHNSEQPARNVETASNVIVIMPLPLRAVLPPELYQLNIKLLDMSVYVRLDVNSYMEGLIAWQRYVSFLMLLLLHSLILLLLVWLVLRLVMVFLMLLLMLLLYYCIVVAVVIVVHYVIVMLLLLVSLVLLVVVVVLQ
jgi:hypothetical protein